MAAGLLLKPAFRRLKRRLDYAEVGGAPLPGVDGTCIIAHGRSNPRAIKNAIKVAARCAAGVADFDPAGAGTPDPGGRMIAAPRDVHIVGTGSHTPTRPHEPGPREDRRHLRRVDHLAHRHQGAPDLRPWDALLGARDRGRAPRARRRRDRRVAAGSDHRGDGDGGSDLPSTACLLQDNLGAIKAHAFDVSAACAGFLYGLSLGYNAVRVGAAETVLVIGVETLAHRELDRPQHLRPLRRRRGRRGAPVDRAAEGILSIRLHSDGSLVHLLEMPAGGSLMPPSHETVDKRLHTITMSGNDASSTPCARWSRSRWSVWTRPHTPEELDLIIPHQANLRIIDATARRLGLPAEKVFVNVDRYGNTSSASIPLAMDEARRTGASCRGAWSSWSPSAAASRGPRRSCSGSGPARPGPPLPGTGLPGRGHGKALAERYPEARRLRGGRSRARLRARPSVSRARGRATRTENTQPALLATSVAAWRVLERKGIAPSAAAGHSAGEYAAHVAAGTFSYEDGLRLIRARRGDGAGRDGAAGGDGGGARPGHGADR